MTESETTIELLYFDDCPSWKTANVILRSVLEDIEIDMSISLQRVETQEEAVQYRFVGSPSIRINGEDLFPTVQENFALGCRVYPTPEGFSGWPTKSMLKEALVKHFDLD